MLLHENAFGHFICVCCMCVTSITVISSSHDGVRFPVAVIVPGRLPTSITDTPPHAGKTQTLTAYPCAACECVRVRFNQVELSSLQPEQSQQASVISISRSQLFVSRQMIASLQRTVNNDPRLFYFRPFHLIKYWTKPTGRKHAIFLKGKEGIHGSDSTHKGRASRSG